MARTLHPSSAASMSANGPLKPSKLKERGGEKNTERERESARERASEKERERERARESEREREREGGREEILRNIVRQDSSHLPLNLSGLSGGCARARPERRG